MTKNQQSVLQQFQLTSDLFFSVALQDICACQEVLEILLEKKLTIVSVKAQYSIRQLLYHSITLDILAYDESGTKINLEMHPQSDEAREKRMRYNLSSIDIESLEKSMDYKNIPNIIGIYITQADFLHTRKGINHVIRTVEGTNKPIPNGVEEYYICLRRDGNTPKQTALMCYLQDSNSCVESTIFPNLVKRVQYLKNEPKGIEIMCEIMDKLMAEAATEATLLAESKATKKLKKLEKKLKAKISTAETKAITAETKATTAEAKATTAEAKGIIEALQELDFSPEDIIAMLMKKLQVPEVQARSLLHR